MRSTTPTRSCLLSSLLLVLGPLAPPHAALAQEGPGAPARPATRPLAAVLEPSVADESDAGLASAFERVLRARLDALEVVRLEGTPALNLPDLQLAVGCVAETDTCLAQVAEQLEVDALVVTTIEHADDTLVAEVRFFHPDGESRTAVRRATGDRAPNELLAEVDPMVRELFDLPPPDEPIEPVAYDADAEGDHADTGAAGDGEGAPESSPPPEEGLSPWPFVVGGVGVAALATGVVFGLLAESTEGDWADAPTATMAQVDAALALRDRAETQATVANILLGVGGALVVAGAALFVVLELDLGTRDGDSGDEAVLSPWIGPGGGGLAVAGRFGGES